MEGRQRPLPVGKTHVCYECRVFPILATLIEAIFLELLLATVASSKGPGYFGILVACIFRNDFEQNGIDNSLTAT